MTEFGVRFSAPVVVPDDESLVTIDLSGTVQEKLDEPGRGGADRPVGRGQGAHPVPRGGPAAVATCGDRRAARPGGSDPAFECGSRGELAHRRQWGGRKAGTQMTTAPMPPEPPRDGYGREAYGAGTAGTGVVLTLTLQTATVPTDTAAAAGVRASRDAVALRWMRASSGPAALPPPLSRRW